MDVKTLCLGILSRGDATGYEIKKICEEGPFAYFYAAGFGSIYPALNALCDDGMISVREVSQEGRPAKKVYTITQSGRMMLSAALSQPPAPDRLRSDFLFVAFFGELLPARDIDRLIGDRIASLQDRLGEMKACYEKTRGAGEAFALGYGLTAYETAIDYLESHRHELVGAALRQEINGSKTTPRDPHADGSTDG